MSIFRKILIFVLVGLIVVPQITFAAWWNPFTWKVFNRAKAPNIEVQKPVPASEIDKLRSEIEELKKKSNTPAVTPPKPSSSISGTIPTAVKSKPLTKLTNSQIIGKIKPAAVYIETRGGAGSGMIFTTDGYVLTNAHVIKGYSSVDISISSGETLSGKVVGRDEEADLAVVKITSGQTFPKIDLGDSSKTEQGEEVFALGFPFGIKGDVSFKEGTISRRIEGYFETSAEIHPGNSGGPLVNRYGQVIGINTAIYGKSVAGLQLGETIKLAIPINTAKNLIADLKAGKNIVVESQEEKQAKIEATNRTTCLTKSESYYNELVSKIEQLYSRNDPELQSLTSQIDQRIENLKRILSDSIALYTNDTDKVIAELRRLADSTIQQIKLAAARGGVSMDNIENGSDIVSIRERLNRDIAYYESGKQLKISTAELAYGTQIEKYEALKTKAYSDQEKNKQVALENAKTNKAEYYNKCLSEN